MRKMLEELFYGNINPNEKQFIRDTDYDRAMRTLSENEDKLTGLLEGEEMIQKLIVALEDESIKYEVFYKLVVASGMRRGECSGLRWSDIDFRENTIHIQRNATARFKKILKKSGLPEKLNVHSLRHTNASLMIAGGVDVATAAGLLGHAQPSTTLDIYSHALDKNKKKAHEQLQKGPEI